MRPVSIKSQVTSVFHFRADEVGIRLEAGIYALRTEFPDVHSVTTKPRVPTEEDDGDTVVTIVLTIKTDGDGFPKGIVEHAHDRAEFIFDDVFMGRTPKQLRIFDRDTGEDTTALNHTGTVEESARDFADQVGRMGGGSLRYTGEDGEEAVATIPAKAS
jgi:hypothetical protein